MNSSLQHSNSSTQELGPTPSGSRTQKAAKNVAVGLLCYLFPVFTSFLVRTFFISKLGAELLGLNNIVLDLLNTLNTAELGLSGAIAFSLYAPLYEGDRSTINEIITLQGKIYRWIARFIIVAATILLFFFPMIFAKVSLPLWYAYATYAVLLVTTLASYYFNYRQVLFASDQKDYISALSINLNKGLKQLAQVLVLLFVQRHVYLWWLFMELLFTFFQVITLEYFIRKHYPWLQIIKTGIKPLAKKHSGVLKKTKQMIFHRISSAILSQGIPLVVFGLLTATMVTVYKNYFLIYSTLSVIVYMMYTSLQSGIGNKIIETQTAGLGQAPVLSLWSQLYTLRAFLASLSVGLMIVLLPSFIVLWVGPDMLFSSDVFLCSLIYFYLIMNRAQDTFLAAYGLFQDIWAPVVEMSLSLGGAIVLGLRFGLAGVFIGVSIGLFVIVHGWKYYFLYRQGFQVSPLRFFPLLVQNLMLSALVIGGAYFFLMPQQPISHWQGFIKMAIIRGGIMVVASLAIYMLLSAPFRITIKQFSSLLRKTAT